MRHRKTAGAFLTDPGIGVKGGWQARGVLFQKTTDHRMNNVKVKLIDQPKSVAYLFSTIDGKGRYNREDLPSGRVQLMFNGAQIGGWADDSNGPHWYVLENKRTVALHPSYKIILEHFGFERIGHGERRYYWRVRGTEGMWLFKRAVEEITGVRLPTP